MAGSPPETPVASSFAHSAATACRICSYRGINAWKLLTQTCFNDARSLSVGSFEGASDSISSEPNTNDGSRLSNRSEEPRLNSSHSQISYAVFCLKKKKYKEL